MNHNTAKQHIYKRMVSPVGTLTLAATDQGLAAILWENDRPSRVRLHVVGEVNDHPILVEAERQLAEYFAGRRTAFTVKLDVSGTGFQRSVWNALLTIPFGETRSYADIARDIGNSRAVRAVGSASGRNPLSIVVPCHRVVGSSGALTGFAGGLEVKARLLAHEAASGAAPPAPSRSVHRRNKTDRHHPIRVPTHPRQGASRSAP
jgi:methylated-DNA-[protein]-cysteine S-methyltransferase